MKLPATEIGTFALNDLKGSFAVLYFYPRDNTPGCTTETADFGKKCKAFEKLGVKVIGVSADSLSSHEKFAKKLGLTFPLVSDEKNELCEKFDVIKMKSMYGKKFQGIERSTFILDKKGKIVKEWRKVKVPGHVDEVFAAVKELI